MLFRKLYCTLIVLIVSQLNAQKNQIVFSSSENKIKKIEDLVLQEKPFDTDTLGLKTFLQPLQTKENGVIYDALLANGYSNFYNTLNKQSKSYYIQSLKKAALLKDTSIEIWVQLNYVSYLYHYRDYVNMTPLLIKIIDGISRLPKDQIILPGQSFKKIGWIMQTFGDYKEALEFLNLAKKYTPKNTPEYAEITDALGLNYFNVGNIKTAEFYLNQARVLAKQINDEVRYAKILGNLALLQRQKGDLKTAISLLKEDITISERKKSYQNTMYACILLAELYLADNNLDKAEETLKKGEKIAYSQSYFEKSELQIIKLKLEVLKKQNKTDNELILRRRMIVLEDSLQNKDGDIAISKANWILEKTKFQESIKKTKNQYRREVAKKNIYAYITILAFLLAFLLVFFILKKYKKQLKTRKIEYKQKVSLQELEKAKIEQKLAEANNNLNAQVAYLKDKNIQIKNLKVEIDKIKQSSSYYNQKETGKLNTLLESHLMTENNWNNFKREFKKEHPEFYNRLQSDFPEITDSNMRILLLQKLNFNNSEIAELLGITTEAVKKSNQRLKKKLGEKFNILFEHIYL
ncbi:Tetratricopeptide repeat-containing protein [Flavobacterium aquidurense]|uniref:Tetratricopeptide repeat-containing protein n=1 Tax=Flavobacterium frigidimaris TaxID=262320 RepID=A0ABX4BJV7_FLAFR|nr:tetratricopeptide repeat protein [Flavobacterium frigidimaris]OXA75335.1 hypothetical protein B0A65_22185 [Flavobacterium frigidimaris]SDZ67436.1 Tetratricopeptide repeat-containing protein [Flavobacterium aquidurense]